MIPPRVDERRSRFLSQKEMKYYFDVLYIFIIGAASEAAPHPRGIAALACLKEGHVAWCISDAAGRYPYREAATSDFVYVRLHGSKRLYASCYSDDELSAWAARIRSCELDTYVYFDNDFMGYAPTNALRLGELL